MKASAGVSPARGGGGNSGPEEGGVALRDALSCGPVWEGRGLPAESLELCVLKKCPGEPSAGSTASFRGRRETLVLGGGTEGEDLPKEGTGWKKSRDVPGCGDPRDPVRAGAVVTQHPLRAPAAAG